MIKKVLIQEIRKSVAALETAISPCFDLFLTATARWRAARDVSRDFRWSMAKEEVVADRQRAYPPGSWHEPKIARQHQQLKPEADSINHSARPRG